MMSETELMNFRRDLLNNGITGYSKNDLEYLNTILTGNSQPDIGTIIHYARKFGYKGTTKTFKENSLGGDHKRAIFIPTTDNKFKRRCFSSFFYIPCYF